MVERMAVEQVALLVTFLEEDDNWWDRKKRGQNDD